METIMCATSQAPPMGTSGAMVTGVAGVWWWSVRQWWLSLWLSLVATVSARAQLVLDQVVGFLCPHLPAVVPPCQQRCSGACPSPPLADPAAREWQGGLGTLSPPGTCGLHHGIHGQPGLLGAWGHPGHPVVPCRSPGRCVPR